MIASNFAEASDALERGTYIELGLVLFGLTIIINGLARVLVLSTTKKGAS